MITLVADPGNVAVRLLVPELLRQLRTRSDCSCAGMVLTGSESTWEGLQGFLGQRVIRALQVGLGSGRWESALSVRPLMAERLATAHTVPLLLAPGGDPNHPEVLDRLRRDLEADVAFHFYGTTRFGEALLSAFDLCINYHNGLLPRFRGLRASNWSLYLEEPTSGYCFHRMDSGMDTGSILADESVVVMPGDTPADLELRKAQAACCMLPRMIDAAVRRETGHPQAGIGGDHNLQAYRMATHVEDPTSLTRAEWFRRLRAFLRIRTRIAEESVSITGLRPVHGPRRLAFLTADGHWLGVCGIDFWPARLVLPFRGRP